MSLTINAKTYTADSFQTDQVGYNGPNQTLTAKDKATMRRIMPKPTAVFSGVSRAYGRLTRTLALTGALTPTADAYVSIEVMVPVGAASADIDTLLNDMGAFLASAQYKTHVKVPQVSF